MSSNTPRVQSTHPMGDDGVVRCSHGEEAKRFVSYTSKNFNRAFYKCSRPKGEECKLWLWADDPIFERLPSQGSSPQSAAHPSVSSQNGPPNGTSTLQPSPLLCTPSKRRTSDDSRSSQTVGSGPSSADTPSKKVRLRAIEAGLQARLEDEFIGEQEQPGALPFTNDIESIYTPSSPSLPSDADTVIVDSKPPEWYGFLGLPPTQESRPSTPGKRPAAIVHEDSNDSLGESSLYVLPTPPRTVRHVNRSEAFATNDSGSSRPEPVTPTRRKGKERATPRWDQFMEDEDNSLADASTSFQQKLETEALRHSPGIPTTAESITKTVREMCDAVDTLRKGVEDLNQHDMCNYIERLERQKNALQLADAAKKKRIEELEEQVRQKEKVINYLTEQLTAGRQG